MLKPVGHRVLVKVNLQKTSAGGLVIVMNEKQERAAMETGELIDVGPDAWKAFSSGNPWAQVGDMVVFSKYGGKVVEDPEHPYTKDSTEFYLCLNDDDILCKVIKEE